MIGTSTHPGRATRASEAVLDRLLLRDPETGEVAELRFREGVLVIQVPGHVVVDLGVHDGQRKIVLGAAEREVRAWLSE